MAQIDNDIFIGDGITFDDSVNVLDTYVETTTFLPNFRGSGTAGTFTYVAQNALYSRTGNIVWVAINAQWTGIGGATGSLQVSNLPYVQDFVAASFTPLLGGWQSFGFTNSPGAGQIPALNIQPGTAILNINLYGQSSGAVTNYSVSANNGISCSFWYFAVPL